MAISIDWGTKVINVPKADTSLVSIGPPEIRELDVDQFRKDLNALQASVNGIWADTTHVHNTTVTLGGVTYQRKMELINSYTVTFENGAYAVNLVNGDNNISDVMNLNTVSLRSANSAGAIVIETGVSGLTLTESTQLDSINTNMDIVRKLETGRWRIDTVANTMIFYDDDGVVPLYTFDLKDAAGLPVSTNVFERIPV